MLELIKSILNPTLAPGRKHHKFYINGKRDEKPRVHDLFKFTNEKFLKTLDFSPLSFLSFLLAFAFEVLGFLIRPHKNNV